MVAPRFAGIVSAYTPSTSDVVITWIAARDETTVADAISYEIYTASAAVTAERLARAGGAPSAVVVGQTTTTISSLNADTSYAFAMRAKDEAGNASDVPTARTIKTLASPLVPGAPVKDLEALGMTVTPTALDFFDVSGPGASALMPEDIILAENPYGRALRRITSVMPNANGVSIVAEKAALSDILREGSLRSSGTIVDPTGFGDGTLTGAYYRDAKSGVTLSQTKRGSVALNPKRPGWESESDVSLESGVNLDYAFTWEAGFDAEINMVENSIVQPESMFVIFTGKVGIEGHADYNLAGQASYETEKELLTRTLRLRYLIGEIPVWQTITLKVMAKLELEAEASFKAEMDVKAEKELRVGLVWHRDAGFMPVKDDGFTQETTFNIEGEASAKATLRIYPVVSSTLYGVATAQVTVDPTLELDAHARFVPLPVELDKCNLDFSVGVQLAADLTIFKKELAKWESDRYEIFRVPVFSLPELKIIAPKEANICHPAKLLLLVSNGYNNTVQQASIHWEDPDPGPASISPADNPIRADLEATMPGDQTIRVSAYGDGVLGLIGTRHAEVTIPVVDPGVDCSMVPESTGGDPISCIPMDSGFPAPPYFTKTRAPWRSGEAELRMPFHAVRDQWITFVPVKWSEEYQNYYPFPNNDFPPVNNVAITPPFDGEHNWGDITHAPIWAPGRYSVAAYMLAYDVPILGAPAGLSPCGPSGTGERTECTFLGIGNGSYSENSAWWISLDEHDGCQEDSGGLPLPVIDIIGPEDPADHRDDAKHALPFAHNERLIQELHKKDKDFVKYIPAPDSGIYDTERRDPNCAVVVRAEGTPPVLITVYEGEEHAGNEGPSVVEGYTQVRFDPNPASVYFARYKYGDAEQEGEYVAEIKSDCTQETAFPLLSGVPTVSSSIAVYRQMIDVTLPINQLTRSIWIELREAVDLSTWIAGNGSIDVPIGATEVTIPIAVWNGGFPDGRYYLRVTLGDQTRLDSQTLLSTYVLDSTLSETDYTLTKNNAIAGSITTELTTLPVVFVEAGPP